MKDIIINWENIYHSHLIDILTLYTFLDENTIVIGEKIYRYFKLVHEGTLLKKIQIIKRNIIDLENYIKNYESERQNYHFSFNEEGEIIYEKKITTYTLTCLSLFLNKLNAIKISPSEFIDWLASITSGDEFFPQSLKRYIAIKNKNDLVLASTQSYNKPVDKKWKHGCISRKEAAKELGVSEKQIYDWEKGRRTPEGYPVRNNKLAFSMFAVSYYATQKSLDEARKMNRPYFTKNIDIYSKDEDKDDF